MLFFFTLFYISTEFFSMKINQIVKFKILLFQINKFCKYFFFSIWENVKDNFDFFFQNKKK